MAIVFAMAVPHPPIIIPDIGRGEERKIQNTIDGYMEVARRAAEFNPDTVVVLSPHSTLYSDYFHISPGKSARGDFGRFGARRVSVEMEYDTEFVHELSSLAEIEGFPAGTLGERDSKLDRYTCAAVFPDTVYAAGEAGADRYIRAFLSRPLQAWQTYIAGFREPR